METPTKIKWGFLRILAIIFAVDIILAIGYETKIIPQNFLVYHHDFHSASDKNNVSQGNGESANDNITNKSYTEIQSDKTISAISNRTFVNDENGLYTVIKFEPTNEGSSIGAMMLSQNQCNYSYSYSINENRIETKFIQSSCGSSSSSPTLYYIVNSGAITTNIEGQVFIFKPL